jgi:hypothetical protein
LTTTVVGSAEGYNDGIVSDALFRGPSSVAVHQSSGSIIICEQLGSRIRAIVPGEENSSAGGSSSVTQVVTLAGSFQGDSDDIGTSAAFQHPWGIAIHQPTTVPSDQQMIYVSDNANHRIKALIPVAGPTKAMKK